MLENKQILLNVDWENVSEVDFSHYKDTLDLIIAFYNYHEIKLLLN